MNRREALMALGSLPMASAAADVPKAGRLKQSLARWCYAKIPIDDLCRQAADLGIMGMDLVNPPDWPTPAQYGITPTMVQGAGTFTIGWNKKENHERLEKQARESIVRAAEAKVPNVITLFGARGGMSDAEGIASCVEGLNKVKKFAEDNSVTLAIELLNSNVDHKDYQGDHTQFGVEIVKASDSPRLKLLYDIYHMQIMEGDIIRTIQYICHFHTGGVPGRHEIDETQELNWRAVAKAIADLNFPGYIAHEFAPVNDPIASLRKAVEHCTV